MLERLDAHPTGRNSRFTATSDIRLITRALRGDALKKNAHGVLTTATI